MSPRLRHGLSALCAAASLALLSRASLAEGPPPSGRGCPLAISPENATKLFEALKSFQGNDGCALDQVQTDRDQMQVTWIKGAIKQPAVLVEPSSCAKSPTARGASLSMTAPEATDAQCPAAMAQMKSVISADAFGELVRTGDKPARGVGFWAARIAPGVALLLALIIVLLRRRRRAPTGGSGA